MLRIDYALYINVHNMHNQSCMWLRIGHYYPYLVAESTSPPIMGCMLGGRQSGVNGFYKSYILQVRYFHMCCVF
jgi:hypothetical protein